MTLPQFAICGIIVLLFLFSISSSDSKYIGDQLEKQSSRGCVLFLATILTILTLLFWNIP